MNPTDEAKTVAMVVLCVGSLLLGMLPIWIARYFNWRKGGQEMSWMAKTVLSALLCFGAGVLMATALVHLLPEIQEGVEELKSSEYVKTDLPLAEIFLSAGFFLVYLVEEVVHIISDRHAHSKTDVSIHRSVGVRECSISREGQPVPPCTPAEDELDGGKCRASSICTAMDGTNCDDQRFCRDVTEISVDSCSSATIVFEESKVGELALRKKSVGHHHHHHHISEEGDSVLPSVRGFLVILGLSLHELFEGMAIGLESSPENVWGLFAAVACHKFVIAFCIGFEMTTSGVRISLHFFYILVLALVTSAGIGIGMALQDGESDALALTNLVLQGLAAGTLIYVAFFEVMERERSKSSVKLLQWGTLLLGFLAMIGLEVLLPEPEEGESELSTTMSTIAETIATL